MSYFSKILHALSYARNRLFFNPEQYARKLGVIIGENCYIETRNFGSEPYLITIGNWVQITTDVTFLTHGGIWALWLCKLPFFRTV